MAQEGDGGGSPKWDSALTEDALKVVPSNVISLVDGAPARECELARRWQRLLRCRWWCETPAAAVPTEPCSALCSRPSLLPCAEEKEQLMNRIQVLAAERYDALARAFFQRRWAAASLAALQDYQERAANVRFTVRPAC